MPVKISKFLIQPFPSSTPEGNCVTHGRYCPEEEEGAAGHDTLLTATACQGKRQGKCQDPVVFTILTGRVQPEQLIAAACLTVAETKCTGLVWLNAASSAMRSTSARTMSSRVRVSLRATVGHQGTSRLLFHLKYLRSRDKRCRICSPMLKLVAFRQKSLFFIATDILQEETTEF